MILVNITEMATTLDTYAEIDTTDKSDAIQKAVKVRFGKRAKFVQDMAYAEIGFFGKITGQSKKFGRPFGRVQIDLETI